MRASVINATSVNKADTVLKICDNMGAAILFFVLKYKVLIVSVTRYTQTFVMFNLTFMIIFCLNYEKRKLVSCCSHLRENLHWHGLFLCH